MTIALAIVLSSPIWITLAIWIFLRLTHDEPNLDELSFEARELPPASAGAGSELPGHPDTKGIPQ